MATLVQNWLNSEVGLSRKITDCEKDFKDGSLLLELLYHVGMISAAEFSKFQNSEEDDEENPVPDTFSTASNATQKRAEAEWKVKKEEEIKVLERFKVITDALSKSKIKYSPDIVGRIMTEQYGAASSIAIAIKALDTGTLSHQGTLSSMTKKALKSKRPREFIREETVKTGHCGDVITELMEDVDGVSWNKVDMAVHLKPFRDHRRQIEGELDRDEEFEHQQKLETRAARRIQELKNMEEKREFYRQWEAEGKKKWSKNMRTKKGNFIRLLNYEIYTQKKRKIIQANQSYRYKSVCEQGVLDFEANLLRLGIDPGDGEDVGNGEPGDLIEKNIVPSKEGEMSFFQRLIRQENENKDELKKECAEFQIQVREKANKIRLAAKEKEVRARKEKCDAEKAAEVPKPDPDQLLLEHMKHQSKRISEMQEKKAHQRWIEQERDNKAKMMAKDLRNVMDEAVAKFFEEMNNSGRVEEILQKRKEIAQGKPDFSRELQIRKRKKHTHFISEMTENYIDFVLQLLMIREHGFDAKKRRGEEWEKVLDGTNEISNANEGQLATLRENYHQDSNNQSSLLTNLTKADILSVSEWNSLKARFIAGENFANLSLENQLAKEEDKEQEQQQQLTTNGSSEEDDEKFMKIDEESTISKVISKQWYKDWGKKEGSFKINPEIVTPLDPLPDPDNFSIVNDTLATIKQLCSKEGPSISLTQPISSSPSTIDEEIDVNNVEQTSRTPLKLLYIQSEIKEENNPSSEDTKEDESVEESSVNKETVKDDFDGKIIEALCAAHNLIPLSSEVAIKKAMALASPNEEAETTNEQSLTEDENILKELGTKYLAITNDPKSKEVINDLFLVDMIKAYAKCYTDVIPKEKNSQSLGVTGGGDIVDTENIMESNKANLTGFLFHGDFTKSSLRLKLFERAFGSSFIDDEVTQYIGANQKKEKGKKETAIEEPSTPVETVFDLILLSNAEVDTNNPGENENQEENRFQYVKDMYTKESFANTFNNDLYLNLSLLSPVSVIASQESADLAITCQQERKKEYRKYKAEVAQANTENENAAEKEENMEESEDTVTAPTEPTYQTLQKMIEIAKVKAIDNLPKASKLWRNHLLETHILDIDVLRSTILNPWTKSEDIHRRKSETMLLNIVRGWRDIEQERQKKRGIISILLRKSLRSSYSAACGQILSKLEKVLFPSKEKKRTNRRLPNVSHDLDEEKENFNVDWVEEIETHFGDVVDEAYNRYTMVSSELSIDLQEKMYDLYRLVRSCVSYCINAETERTYKITKAIAEFDVLIDSSTESASDENCTSFKEQVDSIVYNLVDELDDGENNVKDNDMNDNLEEDEIRIALRQFISKIKSAVSVEFNGISSEATKGIISVVQKGVENTLSILSMVYAMDKIAFSLDEEDQAWAAGEIKKRTRQQHQALAQWVKESLYNYTTVVNPINGRESIYKNNKSIEDIYSLLQDTIENSPVKETANAMANGFQKGIEEEERSFLLPQSVKNVVSEPSWGFVSFPVIEKLATVLRSVSKEAGAEGLVMDTDLFCYTISSNQELLQFRLPSNAATEQLKVLLDPYNTGRVNWGYFIHSCIISAISHLPSLEAFLLLLKEYGNNVNAALNSSSLEKTAESCLPDSQEFKLWSETSIYDREISEDFTIKRKAMEPAEVEKQEYDRFYRNILLILLDASASTSASFDIKSALAMIMMPWCQQLFPRAGNTSSASKILPCSLSAIVYMYFFLSTAFQSTDSTSNNQKLSLTSSETKIFTHKLPKELIEKALVHTSYLSSSIDVQQVLESLKEMSSISIEDLYQCTKFVNEMKEGLIAAPQVSTAIALGRL